MPRAAPGSSAALGSEFLNLTVNITKTSARGPRGWNQAQSARIFSAFLTSSSEPVKLNFNFPALRVTTTLIEDRPLRCMRKWSCL